MGTCLGAKDSVLGDTFVKKGVGVYLAYQDVLFKVLDGIEMPTLKRLKLKLKTLIYFGKRRLKYKIKKLIIFCFGKKILNFMKRIKE